MDNFTKGPWKVYSAPLRVGMTKIIEIQDVNKTPIVGWSGFDSAMGTYQRKLSNARLISAAPEMYAVCDAFVGWWESRRGSDDLEDILANALYALRKARGYQ